MKYLKKFTLFISIIIIIIISIYLAYNYNPLGYSENIVYSESKIPGYANDSDAIDTHVTRKEALDKSFEILDSDFDLPINKNSLNQEIRLDNNGSNFVWNIVLSDKNDVKQFFVHINSITGEVLDAGLFTMQFSDYNHKFNSLDKKEITKILSKPSKTLGINIDDFIMSTDVNFDKESIVLKDNEGTDKYYFIIDIPTKKLMFFSKN
ncbi:MAG: hypothetical protein RR628_00225 [Clostridium sp.]|uniref:hypothetical protein n=1 Tax=Clostridium sp. TaxID=1506 RepID=UPI002FC67AD2